jgi:hypothetical protein
MRLAFAFATLAVSSAAVAQPSTEASRPIDKVTTDQKTERGIVVGLAVNSPLRWAGGDSVGFSGYVGLAKHHMLRLNVATYAYAANSVGLVAALALGEDGDEAQYDGRTTDVGIGYQYYSRGPFDGLMLEAGVFQRDLATRYEDDFASPSIRETNATGYAGRAMIGWSWLMGRKVFIAVGAGASFGRYSGTETTAETTYMPEYTSKDFVRYETVPEGYVRIGLALGL